MAVRQAIADARTAPAVSRAIGIENVSKAYGGVTVLRDVSLSVRPGEFVSLLGPSGCGKTTLLHIVAGLVSPDNGEVHVGNRLVAGQRADLPPEQRMLGVVFQDYALWPHMSVRQQVAFPLEMRRAPRSHIERRVAGLLELTGLQSEAEKRPGQLSGGQQQRVALARALACEPIALLLDEPLSNLNAALRTEMRRELTAVCQTSGVACMYVTHDQSEALSMSDRVVVMASGLVLQDARPAELFARPESDRVAHIAGCGEIIDGHFSAGAFRPDGMDVSWEARVHPRLADGGPAAVVVPAARLTLASEPMHSNDCQVKVEHCSFQGVASEATCRLPNGQAVRALIESPLPPGTNAWLSFRPEHAYITCKETNPS